MGIRLTRDERRRRILAGLAIAPVFRGLIEGGFRIRDDLDMPGRRYFLGHVARETRNKLVEHVAAFFLQPLHKKEREEDIGDVAREWIAQVSPVMAVVPEEPQVELDEVCLPIEIARRFDLFMKGHASVEGTLRERNLAGLKPLLRFVPRDVLEAAANDLSSIRADKIGHVAAPLKGDIPFETVHDIWDQLEEALFDIFGSPALAELADDAIADALNAL